MDVKEMKKLPINELDNVCEQLRSTIIKTVSTNGGHLSSNLGVVELTVALHYVFDSPKDLFFFDVSHQTYVHKLLTNRSDNFHLLRKLNGLSGFSSKSESPHDIFEAGHSSTSISAALGYLEAKIENKDLFDNAVAIIGDASIVNGLSMEAINYLGSKPEQKLIIILNDNDMGISKNVGGLAKTLNKIRVRNRFRLLRKLMPKFVKNFMKSLAYKKTPFSGFGLKYLGVIDGHNIKELIEYLEYAKKSPCSVILHVKTIKGKGYKFAEEDKTGIWHSTPPFDISSGIQHSSISDTFNYGEHIANYLSKKIDNGMNNLRLITAGMMYGTGLSSISLNHPKNVIDVGIAEENAVVMASSMSQAGLIPFVFIYSTFLQRSYDEIIHDAARNNSHVIFCIDRCGIVDGDGPTHQGIYDVGYLGVIPNLIILQPSSLKELDSMIEYALNNPFTYAIRYPKYALCVGDDINYNSKWNIVKESSNNKYIISYGNSIYKFKELLKDSNIGLINASTIKPLDYDLIKELLINNNQLFIYEEVVKSGNLKMHILNYANDLYLNKLVSSFFIYGKSLDDIYLEVGTKDELIKLYDMKLENFINFVNNTK